MESLRTDHDPRSYVARCGFFTQRPAVVEEYLWELGLPTAAERVFWFHWREGMRAGDWCSSVPIKVVATRCRLDVSTVTRAYQVLKAHQLLRRESAGRDPNNPFQQATAVTEVRLPSELVTQLSRMPRRIAGRPVDKPATVSRPAPAAPPAPDPVAVAPLDSTARKRLMALARKLNGEDGRRFLAALNTRQTTMEFSPDCQLTAEERLVICEHLAHSAAAPVAEPVLEAPAPQLPSAALSPPRRLSLIELARLQAKVRDVVAATDAPEAMRQVAWSIQFGALRRYPVYMALNIAAKKLREGCWSRPNRMPPNWTFLTAVPGLCGAA
jgi:hypothetical protein